MTRNRMIAGLLFLVLAFALVASLGVVSAFAAGEEETITGTVVKTDEGIILEADEADYLIKGQDLSSMVGKVVEVTGVVKETDEGDEIDVKSFQEIQE